MDLLVSVDKDVTKPGDRRKNISYSLQTPKLKLESHPSGEVTVTTPKSITLPVLVVQYIVRGLNLFPVKFISFEDRDVAAVSG